MRDTSNSYAPVELASPVPNFSNESIFAIDTRSGQERDAHTANQLPVLASSGPLGSVPRIDGCAGPIVVRQ